MVGGGGEVKVRGLAGILVAELGVLAGPVAAVAVRGVLVQVAPEDAIRRVVNHPRRVGAHVFGAAIGLGHDEGVPRPHGAEALENDVPAIGGEEADGLGEALDARRGLKGDLAGEVSGRQPVRAEGGDAQGELLARGEDRRNGELQPPRGPENGFACFVDDSWVHCDAFVLSVRRARLGQQAVPHGGAAQSSATRTAMYSKSGTAISTPSAVFFASSSCPLTASNTRFGVPCPRRTTLTPSQGGGGVS